MKINRENVKWAARIMSILIVVAMADGLVATFVRRPFPWLAIIPGSIPLLVTVFVIRPMYRAEKR